MTPAGYANGVASTAAAETGQGPCPRPGARGKASAEAAGRRTGAGAREGSRREACRPTRQAVPRPRRLSAGDSGNWHAPCKSRPTDRLSAGRDSAPPASSRHWRQSANLASSHLSPCRRRPDPGPRSRPGMGTNPQASIGSTVAKRRLRGVPPGSRSFVGGTVAGYRRLPRGNSRNALSISVFCACVASSCPLTRATSSRAAAASSLASSLRRSA
jgi:hypothetical protein